MNTKDTYEIIYWGISVLILVATVYYIATGPIRAVKVGRKLNEQQQKDNAKRNLFLTLFALRGSPIAYDFVKGLNQIDIVFEDVKEVRDAWHDHFKDLHNKGLTDKENAWHRGRVEILSQMAKSLGYGNIKASEIMDTYYPEGHQYEDNYHLETQQDWKTYLKKNIELNTLLIEQLINKKQSGS